MAAGLGPARRDRDLRPQRHPEEGLRPAGDVRLQLITAAGDTEEEAEEMVAIAALLGGVTIGTATVTIVNSDTEPLTADFVGMPLVSRSRPGCKTSTSASTRWSTCGRWRCCRRWSP